MKKPLFSAVMAVVFAAGAAMAPACADGTSAGQSDKAGRIEHKTKIKPVHVKKRRPDAPAVINHAVQEDYYTKARELQMKISM